VLRAASHRSRAQCQEIMTIWTACAEVTVGARKDEHGEPRLIAFTTRKARRVAPPRAPRNNSRKRGRYGGGSVQRHGLPAPPGRRSIPKDRDEKGMAAVGEEIKNATGGVTIHQRFPGKLRKNMGPARLRRQARIIKLLHKPARRH